MRKAIIRRLGSLDYAANEAMNTICANLIFAGRDLKKIVISSCSASDGKSYIAMQTMLNLAKRGKRVVLVDADLRRTFMLSRYRIGTTGKMNGLAHYLAGYCGIEDALYETNISGAYIMPIGREVANPLPLLDSSYFSDLLNYLSERFDMVLIDSPPVGVVIDAAEISKNCDGLVFVVSYNQTHRRELIEAKGQIEKTGCKILGCVINKVSFDTLSARKYYNRTYYSHYGSEYYQGASHNDQDL